MTSRPQVRVVLQSRLSSTRLPGKALLPVGGMPMVALAARRAANTGLDVVVATSTEADDDLIVDAAASAGIPVVRGSLTDPLERFVTATADLADDDLVVRLTADNVLPDGELIELLLDALVAGGLRYTRLGGDDPTLPYGISAEAFTVAALRQADADARDSSDREHVTPAMRTRYGDHRIVVSDLDPAWAGLRCTVDTLEDLVVLGRVFRDVPEPVSSGWRDLAARLATVASAPSRSPVRRPNPIGQGALVLGTVQLGLRYGAANATGQPDRGEAERILFSAAAEGLTHLDTARAYGSSEEQIGDALARGLSEWVGVVTKIAPLEDGPDQDSARLALRASIAESLRALQTERVDAVLLHRAADWARPGVRDELQALLSAGSASVVGCSLSTPAELLAVLEDELCGYVQLPFNLLDRRWLAPEVQAALAGRPDVVVTARSVYLQGLLIAGTSVRWPEVARTHPAAITAGIGALTTELERVSAADLCLAYALGHPWLTSVVVGAETPAQLHETAALARRTPLTSDEIARVHETVVAGAPDLVDPSRWRWTDDA